MTLTMIIVKEPYSHRDQDHCKEPLPYL